MFKSLFKQCFASKFGHHACDVGWLVEVNKNKSASSLLYSFQPVYVFLVKKLLNQSSLFPRTKCKKNMLICGTVFQGKLTSEANVFAEHDFYSLDW